MNFYPSEFTLNDVHNTPVTHLFFSICSSVVISTTASFLLFKNIRFDRISEFLYPRGTLTAAARKPNFMRLRICNETNTFISYVTNLKSNIFQQFLRAGENLRTWFGLSSALLRKFRCTHVSWTRAIYVFLFWIRSRNDFIFCSFPFPIKVHTVEKFHSANKIRYHRSRFLVILSNIYVRKISLTTAIEICIVFLFIN